MISQIFVTAMIKCPNQSGLQSSNKKQERHLLSENIICPAFCSSSTTSAVRVFLLVAQNRCIQPYSPTTTGLVAIKIIQWIYRFSLKYRKLLTSQDQGSAKGSLASKKKLNQKLGDEYERVTGRSREEYFLQG